MLQGLHLAESHADRKTGILADGGLGLRGAARTRFLQGALDDRFEVSLGETHGLAWHGLHGTDIVISNTVFEDSEPVILPARVVAWSNMMTESQADDSGETEEQRQSKSARKREAASLQELGVKLAALPDQEIKALNLPDNLFVALRDLRRLPSHGAQVRQRQYIGKLMRNIDPEPVLGQTGGAQAAPRPGDPVFPANRALARPAAVRTGRRRGRAAAGISAGGRGRTEAGCSTRRNASGWNSARRWVRGSFSRFCDSCWGSLW